MKVAFTIVLGLISIYSSFGQVENSLTKHELVKKLSNEIFDSLVKIRRDLHMHPEVSGNEQRTSKFIEQYLLGLGLEVKTNIGGYGVVGILKGNKKGRKIAWRADMDAIKTDFPDKVDFKSENEGVRHICGHDIHTTIGLGIANILANQKEDVEGTVYFIFQPSEENFQGAKAMIDDGLFDMIKPDEIYGIHSVPLPSGVIMTRPNEVYSYSRRISVKFKNEAKSDDLKQLMSTIARGLFRAAPNSKPWEVQNVVDPKIGLGSPETIYRDYLIINEDFHIHEDSDHILFDNNLFETNRTNLDSIPIKIKQQILLSKYKNQLVSVKYIEENPTVLNDSELTAAAIETITAIYGDKSVAPDYGQIPFFNDDFAYFQQQIPGVYFFLGASDFTKGLISMPHSPDFAADEESIKYGVQYFSSLILERVAN